ncbi:hypothetical protein [Pseudomonas sp. CGJS7]|uniref:hypothetical protein n=1 Tax=Pseudomonas sp. CGJS7 TaxID=3109348 RepID=UPI0030097E20
MPRFSRAIRHTAAATCAAALLLTSAAAQAHKQEVHRQIVLDAVAFMKANPGITNYNRLLAGVQAAGYTIDTFAAAIGQGAYDVDDFSDTYLCGALTGDCVKAPLWGTTASLVNYTSYWHFQDHANSRDVHGNTYGGYNYDRSVMKGDIDKLAADWLWNDHLDDGPGGMKGWFGETSRYNTYGVTESKYRIGSTSTPAMYADFQKMPFQPIANLGQYWFSQFLASPTAQSLGFVLHTTDVSVPQHTWSTSGNNHSDYEAWVENYYHTEKLNDPALVKLALNDIPALPAAATDVRPLMHQLGAYTYQNGAIVLSSTAYADRLAVSRKTVPHAIAMVVRVLDRAAERLSP